MRAIREERIDTPALALRVVTCEVADAAPPETLLRALVPTVDAFGAWPDTFPFDAARLDIEHWQQRSAEQFAREIDARACWDLPLAEWGETRPDVAASRARLVRLLARATPGDALCWHLTPCIRGVLPEQQWARDHAGHVAWIDLCVNWIREIGQPIFDYFEVWAAYAPSQGRAYWFEYALD